MKSIVFKGEWSVPLCYKIQAEVPVLPSEYGCFPCKTHSI
jgi:hypothetical protein